MQQILLDDDAFVFCSHLQMSMISRSDVTGLVAHPCDFYEITVDLLVKFARKYGISTDYLLGLTDCPERPLDLSEEERALVECWRRLTEDRQKLLMKMARFMEE